MHNLIPCDIFLGTPLLIKIELVQKIAIVYDIGKTIKNFHPNMSAEYFATLRNTRYSPSQKFKNSSY